MRQEKPDITGLMKVGELAQAAGVSLTTVKFYVKEGLIRPVCKTGRNMAYYDPAAVDTIRLIRSLQKERFYPLSVIKSLLAGGAVRAPDLALLDAIHKVDAAGGGDTVAAGEALRRCGLSSAQAAALAEAGLVRPQGTHRRQSYTREDVAVMELVARRLDAGIPFQQSVRALAIYQEALSRAAEADVDSFVAGALMARDFTAETGANMIRVSDETLDAFIAIRRKELNRLYGSRRLEDLERFERRLTGAAGVLCPALAGAGLGEAAELCAAAIRGEPSGAAAVDQAAGHYWAFARAAQGDIPRSIAESLRARRYFLELRPAGGGPEALAQRLLKCAWLTLAPEILDCRQAAEAAWEEFGTRAAADCPALSPLPLRKALEEL